MLLGQIPNQDIQISSASNVDEALEYCQTHEVHLVITDITMPQRTGLELLEILQQTRPNIYTAVLSAYDDYQYIRTAMQLGAIDYILKGEMQLADLISVLRKVELFSTASHPAPVVRGTLVKNNDYNLASFLDDTDSLITFLSDVNPELQMHSFIVHIFSLDNMYNIRPVQILDLCNKTLASENLTGSTFQLQNAFWVIYNSNSPILEHQKETQQRLSLLIERNIHSVIQKNIPEESVFTASTAEDLRAALNHNLAILRCRQYYPKLPSNALFAPLDRDTLRSITKKLRFLLDIHHFSDAADYLMQTVTEFHQKRIDPEELKAAINHCIAIIFLNTSELKDNIIFASHHQNINRKLNMADSAESVAASVQEICSLYKEELINSKKAFINPPLKRAVDYINENYMHRLTLEDVAQHVFLNKTYISQMFMKQLNISFVSYLESVRIFKAQELLQNTNMSVTKIAEETGYASQSYFTKAFKKRVGMAPLQYRTVSISDMVIY